MVIRTVKQEDYDSIYHFVKTAFETAQVKDGTEQDFVLRLRAGDTFLPDLEFVAEENGELIGHIMLTKQAVECGDGTVFTGVLVAPLSVALECRSQGVGGKLMRHACDKAVGAGYTAAFLVGNPQYYGRFGFRKTADFGIRNNTDIPDQFVQACELRPDALRGIKGSITITE